MYIEYINHRQQYHAITCISMEMVDTMNICSLNFLLKQIVHCLHVYTSEIYICHIMKNLYKHLLKY